MAQIPTDSQFVQAVSEEEALIQKKREMTGDPNWTPKAAPEDPDHGPGFIPEDIWKKQYSPESKPETEVPSNG